MLFCKEMDTKEYLSNSKFLYCVDLQNSEKLEARQKRYLFNQNSTFERIRKTVKFHHKGLPHIVFHSPKTHYVHKKFVIISIYNNSIAHINLYV